jgi:cation/acetate symporter
MMKTYFGLLIGAAVIRAADRGGNLALPSLALHLGDGPLLGFVAAVSFGTTLAVLPGVVITRLLLGAPKARSAS